MAEASQTVTTEKRNVVVVGKFGAGKSTVCNIITGTEKFAVSSGLDGVTKKIKHEEVEFTDSDNSVKYVFKVVDTVGLFNPESERNSDAKAENKRVLRTAITYLRDIVPEGVNVVLFVLKEGRSTNEVVDAFQSVFKHFGQEVSELSALVITGCEHFGIQERIDLVEKFKVDARTSHIAKFMGKGIYPVGFPDTSQMNEMLLDAYRNGIESDRRTLHCLIKNSEKMRLSKELFQQSTSGVCNCRIL